MRISAEVGGVIPSIKEIEINFEGLRLIKNKQKYCFMLKRKVPLNFSLLFLSYKQQDSIGNIKE